MKAKPIQKLRHQTANHRRERQIERGAQLAHRAGVPQFLARLVGLERAQHLCRDTPILARHD